MHGKKALLCIMILLMLGICGCSDSTKPEDVFMNYSSDWEKKDFKAMYSRLSSDSKNAISEDEFIEQMNQIYEDMGVSKITIETQLPEDMKVDEGDRTQIPFTLSMDTLAGHVDFDYIGTLVWEKTESGEGWFVEWDESMIFPDMESGDRIVIKPQKAVRGEILDRNGKKLAENINAACVGIVPGKLGDDKEAEKTKAKIAEELRIDVEQINDELKQNQANEDSFIPLGQIPYDDQEKINRLLQLQGVMIKDTYIRTYPYGKSAAHLIGYIQNISQDELEENKYEGYSAEDLVGREGIEKLFEKQLKGENGWEIYIEDVNGNKKETIIKKEAKQGQDIRLTIDADIQQALFEEMNGNCGAAAAINPLNGEVLALVSVPSYDPNHFVAGISSEEWSELNSDKDKPLTTRFTKAYTPGAVFEVITAAVGLKTGAINPDQQINIYGNIWQLDTSWGDYHITRTFNIEKPVNLADALSFSDNIYFAKAALKIGNDAFLREVRHFGIGEDIPFVFPVEASRITDSGPFKSDIQLADSGCGQGKVKMSVLHMALVYSTLVNNGNIALPSLEVKSGSEDVKLWHQDVISKQTADILLNSLIRTVKDKGGKALNIIGKEGISESVSDSNGDATKNGWYIAFNADKPNLLITMMIEDVEGRSGSQYVISKIRNVIEQFGR